MADVEEFERRRITVEDAEIKFRNFAGKEGQYNNAGHRNFTLVLPDEVVEEMQADGWNVRYLSARDEGDPDTPIVQVTVRFDKYPPRVVMLTETTRTQLDEGSIEVLDWADIKTVDVIVNGNPWNMNGKAGLKAYLQTMFITIQEDELERKYNIHEDPPSEYGED